MSRYAFSGILGLKASLAEGHQLKQKDRKKRKKKSKKKKKKTKTKITIGAHAGTRQA